MERGKGFEDLLVWQKARQICSDIYVITQTESFKYDTRFVQQIRSSSGSIMDNIAEGYERGGNKEFSNFLYLAKGSCGELRSQIIRAHDVRHIDDPTFEELYKKATILNKGI